MWDNWDNTTLTMIVFVFALYAIVGGTLAASEHFKGGVV